MAKEKGLGRGLRDLWDDNDILDSSSPFTELKISEIQPRSKQPRKAFEEKSLSELSESIKKHGVIQPITVREGKAGLYEIIAGERRWRAAKMAGLTEVPVIIIEADDKKTAELSLIENIQRQDLNPIEEAAAYRDLMDLYGLTQEELAERVSKSRSAVANTLRLLDLPDALLALVKEMKLQAGHARALLAIKNREKMIHAAEIVIEKGLSVRETEALAKRINLEKEQQSEAPVTKVSVDYRAALEKKIRNKIGRPVHISEKGRVKKIEFEYTDNNDLELLLTSFFGKGIFDD